MGLALAALVLWGFADWTWWILAPLFVASLLSRVVFALFLSAWQEWAGTVVLVVVILFLTTWSTGWALVIAVGVAVLGLAWSLRLASPPWLRWVALGVGLVLVLTGSTVEFVRWANSRVERGAQARLAGDLDRAKLRPTSGIEMFSALTRAVADDDADRACAYFTPDAAGEFARVVGAADCAGAIHLLHGQVTDQPTYANALIPAKDSHHFPDKGQPAWASGCGLRALPSGRGPRPLGGPVLGVVRLDRDPRFGVAGGYLIGSYTPCGMVPPGVAPPTPERPLLPSYAPQYATVVTSRVARRDDGVCLYMTDRGRTEFAAAWGAETCAAAVNVVAGQVTDQGRYGDPNSVQEGTKDGSGRVVIDACRLVWSRWSDKPGTPPPGPQLGYITLTRPNPAEVGWMIDGWRRCS